MRLTPMNRLASFALALTLAVPTALKAQNAVPPGQGDAFKDTSMLKLPAGQRAAIFDFEDLECPACARAFPITHSAIDHYKIPLLRHDFLIPGHIWSRDAAITARYLQDKVSPELAEQFRRDVFANQVSIASKDDLQAYTRKWFQTHNQQLPFVMDPSGRFIAEVQADDTLGQRLGVRETPTIIVLAPHGWIQVKDITQLYSVIDSALAESPDKPAAHPAHKPAQH
jgi:protein-disulfide isomerase